MPKIRKQIYLDKQHNQQLKRLAESRGVSEAEIIRQALAREAEAAHVLPLPHDPDALKGLVRAALARRRHGVLERPYEWQREDAYEERLDRLARRPSPPGA